MKTEEEEVEEVEEEMKEKKKKKEEEEEGEEEEEEEEEEESFAGAGAGDLSAWRRRQQVRIGSSTTDIGILPESSVKVKLLKYIVHPLVV